MFQEMLSRGGEVGEAWVDYESGRSEVIYLVIK